MKTLRICLINSAFTVLLKFCAKYSDCVETFLSSSFYIILFYIVLSTYHSS